MAARMQPPTFNTAFSPRLTPRETPRQQHLPSTSGSFLTPPAGLSSLLPGVRLQQPPLQPPQGLGLLMRKMMADSPSPPLGANPASRLAGDAWQRQRHTFAPPEGLGEVVKRMFDEPDPISEGDPMDIMDQALMLHLLFANKGAACRLDSRRLDAGTYEIEGRRVTLRWGPGMSDVDGSYPELIVRENSGEETGATCVEVPLSVYLQQATNVAASLGGRLPGVPSICSLPQDMRLTFDHKENNIGGPQDNPSGDERLLMMRRACAEATLRERAAEAVVKSIGANSATAARPNFTAANWGGA